VEKKRYYVSVGSGQVLDDKEAAAFELEIDATDDDIDKLQELFEEVDSANDAQALEWIRPIKQYQEPESAYDANLRAVYRLLHELGTPETKQVIEEMGILEERPQNGAER
jgi:hypothetical protein